MVSRAERSLLGDWWWTIDKALLVGLGVLMTSGMVFLMAGGPPVAQRLGLDTFHFVNRQALFLIPALIVMAGVSMLTPRLVRRLALVTYLGSLALVLAALEFGPEIKGAHRWIFLGPIGLQPSEFLKPAFVVLAAWAFSERARSDMPGPAIGMLLLPLTIVPLILQPDFGQTMLVTVVWAGLFFLAGLHWIWVIGLGGAGLAGIAAAYEFLPHVRARIERFLSGDSSESFQVEQALASFESGGWLGRGPGEGVVKRILPDAHTDFIFAATAEEFGIAVCLLVVCVYAFIVLRGLLLAQRSEDAFCRMAVAGLLLMFGLQACINMMVNLHLLPAKGMTLPFISYGGSSLISLALATGFLIALTRRRPSAAARAGGYGRAYEPGLAERPA
ncbi:putative peptidoglycan glycosyltransferase FtsW [Salinarimonas sp.]|uniref:FtsW/RodA/SpoVE family cell cycle protein n=1 Tax=Salinarimonas sp. TaxID=2766526 RepID=UPI0032D99C35